jgi:uncharacterized protein (TIRG00374 family)
MGSGPDRDDGRPGPLGRRARIAIAMTAAVALLALLRRSDVVATGRVLGNLAPVPFLVAVGLSGVGILNRAGQVRSAHRVAGLAVDLRSMTRVSAAGYALNKVVKTGGLGGVALFVRHGRHRGLPAGGVLAACLVSSIGGQLSMVAVAVAVVASLALSGAVVGWWLVAVVATVGVVVIGLPAASLACVRSRPVVVRWYPKPFALIARLTRRIGVRAPASPDPSGVDRFYEAVEAVRCNPTAALPVLAHALAAKLIGAAVLAATMAAVGADLDPGAALTIYALALVAAAGTILPGGLGAVEATMTVLLARYGVPPSTALAGTVAFRLLDLWLPVLVGLLAAPGLERATRPEEATDRPRRRAPDRATDLRSGDEGRIRPATVRPDGQRGTGTCDRPSTTDPATIGASPSPPSLRPWGPTWAVSTWRRLTTRPSPRSSGPCTTTACWCSGASPCLMPSTTS